MIIISQAAGCGCLLPKLNKDSLISAVQLPGLLAHPLLAGSLHQLNWEEGGSWEKLQARRPHVHCSYPKFSSFSNINASQIGACLSLISRGLKGLFLSVLSSFIVALWGERLLISYLVIAKSLLFEAIILSLC